MAHCFSIGERVRELRVPACSPAYRHTDKEGATENKP